MFLSAGLCLFLWVYSERWFYRFKYPFKLGIMLFIQFSLVMVISILSTTIVISPESYGDVSQFLPLSYPLTLSWGISNFLVFPPYHYYTRNIYWFEMSGRGLNYMNDFGLRVQIFIDNLPLFLIMNGTIVGFVLLLSEFKKFLKSHWIKTMPNNQKL